MIFDGISKTNQMFNDIFVLSALEQNRSPPDHLVHPPWVVYPGSKTNASH